MPESLRRHHGLETFLAKMAGNSPTDPVTTIAVRGDLGHINLRGRASDAAFVNAVEQELGQALPVQPNTISAGRHQVCWLGPDEWLVVTPVSASPELADRLDQSLSTIHASVNDISGGQVVLMLSGTRSREVLASGCTLDLHPREFRAGDCAQSGLARANVLIALVDDEPTFMVVVRRSFSDYLCRWLARTGSDAGIVFNDT